jgi:GDPmannose 4,6-dehydratase
MSKVFITGITGMDGSYMTDYLLENGHDVCGMVRRHSYMESQQHRVEDVKDKIDLVYGDMADQTSIEKALRLFKPDYIFNMAAMSHVGVSFNIPLYTFDTDARGVFVLLESYKDICPEAKFYQCSSSEMFGLSVDDDGYQRETTPMNPTSPYGIAKVAAYNLVRHYRRAYGLHACNGILFNHTGKKRGSGFVEQKICKSAVEIKLGLLDRLELGNMDTFRDFGSSEDYVRCMWKIVNYPEPMDLVIATGETHSVRDICRIAFGYLGLDYNGYVIQNPKYIRPEELPYLKGDSSKARDLLGWEPTYSIEDLIKEMVDEWLEKLSYENSRDSEHTSKDR